MAVKKYLEHVKVYLWERKVRFFKINGENFGRVPTCGEIGAILFQTSFESRSKLVGWIQSDFEVEWLAKEQSLSFIYQMVVYV